MTRSNNRCECFGDNPAGQESKERQESIKQQANEVWRLITSEALLVATNQGYLANNLNETVAFWQAQELADVLKTNQPTGIFAPVKKEFQEADSDEEIIEESLYAQLGRALISSLKK